MFPDVYKRQVDADAALRVCICTVCIVFVLPEASAEDCGVIGVYSAYADAAQLGIAAAYYNQSAFCEACLQGGIGSDGSGNGAGFLYRREDAAL